jgi:hypothetical protein
MPNVHISKYRAVGEQEPKSSRVAVETHDTARRHNTAGLRRGYGRIEGGHASGFLGETAVMCSSLPYRAARLRGCGGIAPPPGRDNGPVPRDAEDLP